jgi:hypothetical protein
MSLLPACPFVRAIALLICYLASSSIPYAAAVTCGAPLAPCGENLPPGTTCPKGAGWCTAGHYCGYAKGSSKAQCVPIPKNCGTGGNPCCPSNAETPHTSTTPPLDRKPFCKDGSSCTYNPLTLSTSMTPDPYAGVEGELSRAVRAITIHAATAAQYTAIQLNWPLINCHCC